MLTGFTIIRIDETTAIPARRLILLVMVLRSAVLAGTSTASRGLFERCGDGIVFGACAGRAGPSPDSDRAMTWRHKACEFQIAVAAKGPGADCAGHLHLHRIAGGTARLDARYDLAVVALGWTERSCIKILTGECCKFQPDIFFPEMPLPKCPCFHWSISDCRDAQNISVFRPRHIIAGFRLIQSPPSMQTASIPTRHTVMSGPQGLRMRP